MGVNYLIDTHILLWWVFDSPKLKASSRAIIANPEHLIFVSSASAWEIATKYRIGKLSKAKTLVETYTQTLNQGRFLELPITAAHALLAGNLPIEHRDPFDRMLMVQAETEELPIVTYDSAFQTGRIQVIPSTD
ncbi:MAG: type II toxin-antitoxin system VapC family toxin [Cyanobacteria bacterium J06649_5]